MKALILAILAFALPSLASDTNTLTASENVLKSATDQCMAGVSLGEPRDPLTTLFDKFWFNHDDASNSAAEVAAGYMSSIAKDQRRAGKPLKNGYELLGVKRIGSSIVRFVYFQKFEYGVVAWEFSFYKVNDEYKMCGINVGKDAEEDVNSFAISIPAGR